MVGELMCLLGDRPGLLFAQGEDRATGVGQHAVDGTVAGEILEYRAMTGAEDDEAGVSLGGFGKDLDRRVAMHHARLDLGATCGAGRSRQQAQFMQCTRVKACGLAAALGRIG